MKFVKYRFYKVSICKLMLHYTHSHSHPPTLHHPDFSLCQVRGGGEDESPYHLPPSPLTLLHYITSTHRRVAFVKYHTRSKIVSQSQHRILCEGVGGGGVGGVGVGGGGMGGGGYCYLKHTINE